MFHKNNINNNINLKSYYILVVYVKDAVEMVNFYILPRL